MVNIYSLAHPLTGEVKYIGKTRKSLTTRLYGHLDLQEGTAKAEWVSGLIKEGLLPRIEIVDQVSESEWNYWERYWINQFSAWGFNLVNTKLMTAEQFRPPIEYYKKRRIAAGFFSSYKASLLLYEPETLILS